MFKTFADLKRYCGGGINASIDLRSLLPVIEEAAQYHIVPVLGQDLYDSFLSAFTTETLTATQLALLPYVQRPLAKLAIYEYSKVGDVEFGDAGIRRIENETVKSAFKYQVITLREYFLEKGYNDIEGLLKFLDKNSGDYPQWTGSDEGLAHRAAWLRYSSTFRTLLSIECDRYTFQSLMPYINMAQQWMVSLTMPAMLHTDILAKINTGTLSPVEKQLVRLVNLAVGARAMSEAVKNQWIHQKGGRIYVVEEFGEQGAVNRTMPNQVDNHRYWQSDMASAQYNNAWRDFIFNNKATFPQAFDTASGGINTQPDAWHVDTPQEVEEKKRIDERRKTRAIVSI
jgi:hypothetical protein